MALTFRQTRAYNFTVSIIRPERTITDGIPSDDSYSLVASGVKCHLRITQNDSDAAPVGRLKRRSALTEDETHFEISVDVKDGDLIYDATPASRTAGQWGKVQGQPKLTIGSAFRRTNKQSVKVFQEDFPPAGAAALV
jgi:hypothetical protein